MLKRYEIDVTFYDGAYELDNRQCVDGEYCLYEDVNKILQEYEHEINDLLEQLDEHESEKKYWKDMYNALYEQSAWQDSLSPVFLIYYYYLIIIN